MVGYYLLIFNATLLGPLQLQIVHCKCCNTLTFNLALRNFRFSLFNIVRWSTKLVDFRLPLITPPLPLFIPLSVHFSVLLFVLLLLLTTFTKSLLSSSVFINPSFNGFVAFFFDTRPSCTDSIIIIVIPDT